ncbi:MAG: acyclic terpene utilization AtuA family protein [Sneathiella sp.]
MPRLDDKIVKIGCSSGFWGDTAEGARQLIDHGEIDYLVFDYLAEITMSLLAKVRERKPESGYVPDFVHSVVAPMAGLIAKKKIKLIANAGGVNPQACKIALEQVLEAAGVDLKVAAVCGDDLLPQAEKLRQEKHTEMFSGEEMPRTFMSMNAYLGAIPIRDALAMGADIIITGRVVDSAVTLGALMHEFGWTETEYDALASGSLAGHILECGTQATGGLFTDWQKVSAGWTNMGFPIVECKFDGSFTVNKPKGTGGLITPETISEQVVYEVGDPSAYILPDVVCDLTQIKLEQTAENCVMVSGVRGKAPTNTYKVSATWHNGFRATGLIMIGGIDAAAKAQAVGKAILTRTENIFKNLSLGGYEETNIEVLGSEATYGPHSTALNTREIILKIGVKHQDKKAVGIFARELMPSGTSMAQGITGFSAGRPKVQPVVKLFSFLVDKGQVEQKILFEKKSFDVAMPSFHVLSAPAIHKESLQEEPPRLSNGVTVSLIRLAYGRSGDKGNKANIGIMARNPIFLPILRAFLTPERVKEYFSHIVEGNVERFEWPGLNGFNFLLHDALGGGGVASLRYDAQGKALAQMLLSIPVQVPAIWLEAGGPLYSEIQNNGTENAA